MLAALGSDPEAKQERAMLDCFVLRITIEALHGACGGEADAGSNDWDAERILFALSAQGDPMRHAALAASEPFRAELAPELIEELRWWASDPRAALEVDGSLGLHALYLLAKWREHSAWPVFRNLFSLPDNIFYDLLGDLITEEASILLAMVGGHQRDDLRTMVEDEKLDEYCRNACLDALTCLVAWGEMPRAEHLAYLRELLTDKLHAAPGLKQLQQSDWKYSTAPHTRLWNG